MLNKLWTIFRNDHLDCSRITCWMLIGTKSAVRTIHNLLYRPNNASTQLLLFFFLKIQQQKTGQLNAL